MVRDHTGDVPRTLPAVALLTALVLLGGCLSGAPATDSPTPNTDCPYTLSVEVANDDQIERTDSTLAYGNLSDHHQQEFDRALESDDGTYNVGRNLDEIWSQPNIVEKGGEQYYVVAYTC